MGRMTSLFAKEARFRPNFRRPEGQTRLIPGSVGSCRLHIEAQDVPPSRALGLVPVRSADTASRPVMRALRNHLSPFGVRALRDYASDRGPTGLRRATLLGGVRVEPTSASRPFAQ